MVVLLEVSNFESNSKKFDSLSDFLYLKNNSGIRNKVMKIIEGTALLPNSYASEDMP